MTDQKLLFHTLRMEVRQFGIDVVVIEPGGIDTEWGPIAFGSAEEYSGQGAYGPLVKVMMNSSILQRKMPPPRVITDLLPKDSWLPKTGSLASIEEPIRRRVISSLLTPF